MSNLIRMDLFKLRKSKFFLAICITIFAVTFIAPLLIKGFLEILKNMLGNTDGLDDASAAELAGMINDLSISAPFSGILRNPFAGLSMVIIPTMIFIVSFLHLDLNNGYIKNIAGQLPSRGYLAVSKYLVIGFAELVFLVLGIAGSTLGCLVSRGLSFDENIGSGLLELLLKFLLFWGLTAVLLLISNGLGSKTFAIVAGVIFSTGALSIIYMPLSYAFNQLLKTNTIDIARYAPDQMFLATNIDVLAACIGSAVMIAAGLILTIRLMNKKDVK